MMLFLAGMICALLLWNLGSFILWRLDEAQRWRPRQEDTPDAE